MVHTWECLWLIFWETLSSSLRALIHRVTIVHNYDNKARQKFKGTQQPEEIYDNISHVLDTRLTRNNESFGASVMKFMQNLSMYVQKLAPKYLFSTLNVHIAAAVVFRDEPWWQTAGLSPSWVPYMVRVGGELIDMWRILSCDWSKMMSLTALCVAVTNTIQNSIKSNENVTW